MFEKYLTYWFVASNVYWLRVLHLSSKQVFDKLKMYDKTVGLGNNTAPRYYSLTHYIWRNGFTSSHVRVCRCFQF